MKYVTQDNDPLPFITLAACTRNVIEFLLQKQKTEDGATDAGHEQNQIEKPEQDRDYVDRRLDELAAFERRAAGIKKWRGR